MTIHPQRVPRCTSIVRQCSRLRYDFQETMSKDYQHRKLQILDWFGCWDPLRFKISILKHLWLTRKILIRIREPRLLNSESECGGGT